MKVSKEQLSEHIDSHSFGWVKVLDSNDEKVFNYTVKEGKTSADLKKELLKFLDLCDSETFKLQFKTGANVGEADIFTYHFSCKSESRAMPKVVNEAEIEDRIRKSIFKELEQKRELEALEKLKADLAEKSKNLEEWGGRLSMVAEMFINKMVDKYQPVLQGMLGNAMNATLAGTPQTEIEPEANEMEAKTLSEQEQQKLAIAVNTLLDYLTVEEFEKLSKAVVKEPSLINTLRTFNLI